MVGHPFIVFVLFQWIGSRMCIQIARKHNEDVLQCSTDVDCSQYKSERLDNRSCSCKNGTFFYDESSGLLNCIKDAGQEIGCDIHFEFYEKKLQAISILNGAPDEFLFAIKTGKACNQMSILKVEWYNDSLQWSQITNDFRISNLAGTDSFFLRWNYASKASSYAGELLKFTISCQTTSGNALVDGCLVGKILGERTFQAGNAENNVCKSATSTTSVVSTSSSTRGTMKPSTISISTFKYGTDTRSPLSKVASVKDGGISTAVLAGLISGMIILLIIVIVLVVCVRQMHQQKQKRRTFQRKISFIEDRRDLNKTHDHRSSKNGQSELENPSYLTSLHNANNNVRRTNVPSEHPIYSTPNNATPMNNGDVFSQSPSPHDYVSMDLDYESLRLPDSPQYQRLSTKDERNDETNEKDGEYYYRYNTSYKEPRNKSVNKIAESDKNKSSSSPHSYFDLKGDSYEHLATNQDSPPKYQTLNASDDKPTRVGKTGTDKN